MLPPLEITQRLLLAAVLGGIIGVERELKQKAAGVRTNILIALGAALFTLVSITLAGPGGIPDRLAGNIVTGVGFLGGGAILRSGRSVHGMTTAATIWVNAAIGMAAGAGAVAMATITWAIMLIVLAVLPSIERAMERRAGLIVPPSNHMDN
jgi:putative Mg2+ transporter-C (MgtC) family protein